MNRSPALFGAVDGGEFGSPLTTSPRSRAGSLSAPGESDADFMSSASGDEQVGFDEDDAQLLDDLGTGDIPVTGFAVASNKRNADFHELFPSIPEGDYLIEGIFILCLIFIVPCRDLLQITVVRYSGTFSSRVGCTSQNTIFASMQISLDG